MLHISDYHDMGNLWNAYYTDLPSGYDEQKFKDEIESLWLTVRPLYLQLYTYVRRILSQVFPGQVQHFGRLPAHVLGTVVVFRSPQVSFQIPD